MNRVKSSWMILARAFVYNPVVLEKMNPIYTKNLQNHEHRLIK